MDWIAENQTRKSWKNKKHLLEWKRKRKNEKKDQEEREKNSIIYRVEESIDNDPEIRKEHDAAFFDALWNDVLKTGTIKT